MTLISHHHTQPMDATTTSPKSQISTEHNRPADAPIATQLMAPLSKSSLAYLPSKDIWGKPRIPVADANVDSRLIREKSLTSLDASTSSGSSTQALDVSKFWDDDPEPDRITNYKPTPLRAWYLGIVLLAIAVLLCLAVATVRILPDEIKTFAPVLEVGPGSNDTVDSTSHLTRRIQFDGPQADEKVDGRGPILNKNSPRVANVTTGNPGSNIEYGTPDISDYARQGVNVVTNRPRDNLDNLAHITQIQPKTTVNRVFSEARTTPSIEASQADRSNVHFQQASHATVVSTSSLKQNQPRWEVLAWLYAHQGFNVVTKQPRDISNDLAHTTQTQATPTTPDIPHYTARSDKIVESLSTTRLSSLENAHHVLDEAQISTFAAVGEKRAAPTKVDDSSSITCTITSYSDGNNAGGVGPPIKRTAAAHSKTTIDQETPTPGLSTCIQINMVWILGNNRGRPTRGVVNGASVIHGTPVPSIGPGVPNAGAYYAVGRSTVTIRPRDIPLELAQATQQYHAKGTSRTVPPGDMTAPVMVPAQPTAPVLEQVDFDSRTYQGAKKADVRVVPRPRDIGASRDIQSLILNATTTPVTVPPQSTSDSSTSPTNGSQSTENPQSTGETLDFYYISNSQYFVGLFLPTFLSTLLAIPLRIIDFNFKLYRPFHNLARANGATASESLFLSTTGLSSFFTAQDILGCSTMALVALSTVLIPISAEAVHVVMHGDECHAGQGSADNCGFTLGVNPTFAHIVIAILPVMGILLVLVWTRLRRYRTAVPVKPWSMSFISSFASDPAIQSLLSQFDQSAGCLKMKDGMRAFEPWIYTIENPIIHPKAGCRVAILEKSSIHEKDNNAKSQRRDSKTPTAQTTAQHGKSTALYSFILTFAGRILILLGLLGVLLLVVVYTQNTDINGFETFMDSETIGVRIFFSSTGVALTLAWTSFFQGKVYTKPT